MTDQENKFLELSKQYEALKTQMKELKPQLHGLMEEIGVNNYIQDPETMLVYKVVRPTGTFISFDQIGYDRTKTTEEKRGSLSKKEAEEAGFTLSK